MKIDRAGIFDLTMEEYHGDTCVGPSLSASRLQTIIAQCPAVFWETSPLNPNRVEAKATKALDVGRAAHSLTLGEPEFARNFVICPHDNLAAHPGRAWNDEWKASVAAGREKRTLIRKNDFDDITAMAAAQRRSPQVARAFANGKPEQSLIWLDDETGVFLKSRPDWLPNDPRAGYLIDYKTARSIHPRKLAAAAFDYGYHLQAAMQCDGTKAVFDIEPLGIAHVCQEKTAPYLAELKMFQPDQLEFGRREYRRALNTFARCWEMHLAGKPERVAWPGYTVNAEYFETPYWITKQMENPTDEFDRYADAERQYTAGEYLKAG